MSDTASPAISVIMPVFDGRRFLERSLPALFAQEGAPPFEVIVVDDGSRDTSVDLAREHGARIVSSGGRGLGPARARNIGVREAAGEIVVFVDADVAVHADAIARIAQAFADPKTTALYGSYDDEPPHPAFASQYMNLRHHFVHQAPSEDSPTFWAGLGAVRKDAYQAVSGFDADAYDRPCIEDVELGMRIRAEGGKIRRQPDLQGTHLKEWSLASVVRTDIFGRALPWSRLILRNPGVFQDLNVSPAERLKALLAAAFFLSIPGAAWWGWTAAWVPVALLALAGIANGRLVRLFARRNGIGFATGALLFHQVYYVYGSAAYSWCFLEHRLGRNVEQ